MSQKTNAIIKNTLIESGQNNTKKNYAQDLNNGFETT